MLENTTTESKRLPRKRPSDYPLLQFRCDEVTKKDIELHIHRLARVMKKDPRFDSFRMNDIYITCINLGIDVFSGLIADDKKDNSLLLDKIVKKTELRRELQWAKSKGIKISSIKKQNQ